MDNFNAQRAAYAKRIEASLTRAFAQWSAPAQPPETRVEDASAFGLLGGGKRLRAMLALAAGEAVGLSADEAETIAVAVETLHAYSLVHDDLPAMDDADTRRGQPSVHRKYDEVTAILSGDQLLTYALGHLADLPVACRALSEAGARMVRGQMLDLLSEREGVTLDLVALERLQAQKTGAVIRFACEAPALVAKNDFAAQALHRYGSHLGLAFQITDDILDAVSDAGTLGKPVGADAQAGKATFVTLLGLAAARARSEQEIFAAKAALAPLQSHMNEESAALAFLSSLADFVLIRRN